MASSQGRLIGAALLVLIAVAYRELATGSEAAAIVCAGVPLGLALALRAPYLASILFVTVSVFRVHETLPVLSQLQIPLLLSELGIVGFLGWLVFQPRQPLRYPLQLRLFFVFSALVTAGAFNALTSGPFLPVTYNFSVGIYSDPDNLVPYQSWSDSFVKVVIMASICALIAGKPSQLAIAVVLFIAAGLLLSALVVGNKLLAIGLVEGTRAVAVPGSASLLGDPNDTALLILCPFALSSACAVSPGKPWLRVLASASSLVLLAAIIATQSRGGLLGTAAVVGILAMNTLKSRVLQATVVAVGVMGLVVLMGLHSRSSGGAEFARGGLDESSANRLIAWKAAWNMAVENPFLGVGIGGFTPNFYSHAEHWVDHAMAVHSSWFQVLAETGFLGFAVFVSMVAVIGHSLHTSLAGLTRSGAAPGLRTMALGFFCAYCGWVASASFITHGFTWPIYALLALSVIIEKCAILCEPAGTTGRAGPSSAAGIPNLIPNLGREGKLAWAT